MLVDDTVSVTSRSPCVPRHITAHPLTRVKFTIFSRFTQCGLLATIFLLISCSAAGNTEPQISVKPTLLPLKFIAGPTGFAIAGDRTIATPLALISIGAKVNLPAKDDGVIRIVIRDRKRAGIGLDDIYDIKSGDGDFEAVTNGTTVIQVNRERELTIDVTDAHIGSIEFRRVSPVAFEDTSREPSRWSKHWQTLPFEYNSWTLTRWAYDDSTIGKWYGAGFAIFLIRLVAATLLAIFDFLLVAIFFVAGFFYLFSETARNIFYGFLSIFIIWVGIQLWLSP